MMGDPAFSRARPGLGPGRGEVRAAVRAFGAEADRKAEPLHLWRSNEPHKLEDQLRVGLLCLGRRWLLPHWQRAACPLSRICEIVSVERFDRAGALFTEFEVHRPRQIARAFIETAPLYHSSVLAFDYGRDRHFQEFSMFGVVLGAELKVFSLVGGKLIYTGYKRICHEAIHLAARERDAITAELGGIGFVRLFVRLTLATGPKFFGRELSHSRQCNI
jgi:hypothetical protein